MRERPILFSGAMVRAILAGQKTQTRRAVKNVPSWDHFGKDIMDWSLSGIHQEGYGEDDQLDGTDRWYLDVQTDVDDHSRKVIRCPYGKPGDHLWVRETWGYSPSDEVHRRNSENLFHRATYTRPDEWNSDEDPRWRPSIHMPRWACRLGLEITGVRVERLQDISEADAKAEGVESPDTHREDRDWSICPQCGGTLLYTSLGQNLGVCPDTDCYQCDTHAKRFCHLWASINGPESWDANPWVWVLEFKQLTP